MKQDSRTWLRPELEKQLERQVANLVKCDFRTTHTGDNKKKDPTFSIVTEELKLLLPKKLTIKKRNMPILLVLPNTVVPVMDQIRKISYRGNSAYTFLPLETQWL